MVYLLCLDVIDFLNGVVVFDFVDVMVCEYYVSIGGVSVVCVEV